MREFTIRLMHASEDGPTEDRLRQLIRDTQFPVPVHGGDYIIGFIKSADKMFVADGGLCATVTPEKRDGGPFLSSVTLRIVGYQADDGEPTISVAKVELEWAPPPRIPDMGTLATYPCRLEVS